MEKLTAEIDRYLSGEMSSDETLAFEKRMAGDETLNKEVDLQKKAFKLLEAAAYAETRERVKTLNSKKSNLKIMRPLLRVAAVALVLIIPTYFYISSQFNDDHLYASYASPYPDRLTTMGESMDAELSAAMNLYNSASYKKAAEAFEKIRITDTSTEYTILYEATSLTNSNNPKKAIQLLKTALAKNPMNRSALEWQLILAELANENGDELVAQVEAFLQHNDGYQQKNAEQLLSDLKSFWR